MVAPPRPSRSAQESSSELTRAEGAPTTIAVRSVPKDAWSLERGSSAAACASMASSLLSGSTRPRRLIALWDSRPSSSASCQRVANGIPPSCGEPCRSGRRQSIAGATEAGPAASPDESLDVSSSSAMRASRQPAQSAWGDNAGIDLPSSSRASEGVRPTRHQARSRAASLVPGSCARQAGNCSEVPTPPDRLSRRPLACASSRDNLACTSLHATVLASRVSSRTPTPPDFRLGSGERCTRSRMANVWSAKAVAATADSASTASGSTSTVGVAGTCAVNGAR